MKKRVGRPPLYKLNRLKLDKRVWFKTDKPRSVYNSARRKVAKDGMSISADIRVKGCWLTMYKKV